MKLISIFLLMVLAACSSDDSTDNATVTVDDQDTVQVEDSSEVKDSVDVKDTTAVDDSSVVGSKETMYISGRHLYAPDGEKIILRGVNKMTVWNDLGGNDFKEIAKTGANVVRIVWVMDDWAEIEKLDAAIQTCIDNHMIPMIENHDATGEWDKLPEVINWWL